VLINISDVFPCPISKVCITELLFSNPIRADRITADRWSLPHTNCYGRASSVLLGRERIPGRSVNDSTNSAQCVS